MATDEASAPESSDPDGEGDAQLVGVDGRLRRRHPLGGTAVHRHIRGRRREDKGGGHPTSRRTEGVNQSSFFYSIYI
jgi:hypothetical protein